MRLVRLVGVALFFTLGLMVCADAAALAAPEFKTNSFPVLNLGLSLLELTIAGNTLVHCGPTHWHWIILGPNQQRHGISRNLGCTTIVHPSNQVCTQKSVGASEGEIVSTTLKGELGTVKTSEATSGVGILIEPETTKKFYTLVKTECAAETSVVGSVAAEVSPIGVSQLTEKLTFNANGTSQSIKTISVLGKAVKPELEAFGLEATVDTSVPLEFAAAVEVT